jgi:hypothetical protein
MTEKSLPQPSSPSSAPPARSRTFTPYVLIWAGLATLSLIYLGLLATQPALVARYLGAGTKTAAAETEASQKAIGEAVAEVHTLRETIDLFRNELIELRAQVSGQTDAARDLATRMAALEAADQADPQRIAAKDANAKTAAAQAKGAKTKAEPAQTAAATPAQKAAEKAAEKEAAKKAAANKAAPGLETGSVAQPAAGAITFGPPTVTTTIAVPPSQTAPPAKPLIGVQIATGPSVDSLRLSWTLLNERHGDTLRALEPRYTTDSSGAEQTYDLVVGPVASVDEARRLCQELALKATPCSVGRFTGDAL